jgi:serine/threonine protein kinase
VACASPEYLYRQRLAPSSDVFSLGLVLLELLTGRHLLQMPQLYGRMEANEEIARLISEASAERGRLELPQDGIFPEGLEEHELSSRP